MLMERAAVLPLLYADQPEGQLLHIHTNAHTLIQYETAKTPTDNNQQGVCMQLNASLR